MRVGNHSQQAVKILIFQVSTNLKKLHTLFSDFRAEETLTTPWSGSIAAKFKDESKVQQQLRLVIWQSLPKAIPEDNRRFGQCFDCTANQWLCFCTDWGIIGLVKLAITNTGCSKSTAVAAGLDWIAWHLVSPDLFLGTISLLAYNIVPCSLQNWYKNITNSDINI